MPYIDIGKGTVSKNVKNTDLCPNIPYSENKHFVVYENKVTDNAYILIRITHRKHTGVMNLVIKFRLQMKKIENSARPIEGSLKSIYT